jgi:hypothetical protein
MTFSKKSHEGCIMVDHRASPGIPAELAPQLGYRPEDVAEGKLYETVTYGCKHCGLCYVKNPWRMRPREHCFTCNRDICDACYAESKLPGYVHMTFEDKAEALAQANQLADFAREGRRLFTEAQSHSTVNSPVTPAPLRNLITGD